MHREHRAASRPRVDQPIRERRHQSTLAHGAGVVGQSLRPESPKPLLQMKQRRGIH